MGFSGGLINCEKKNKYIVEEVFNSKDTENKKDY